MSKNTKRSNGVVGFIVALLLLGFVIYAGQSNAFGPVSEGLRGELSAIFAKGQDGFHLTVAKILAAIGALALTYLIIRILCLLLDLFGRSNRAKTVNELLANIITYVGAILGIVWALTILGLNPTAAFASLGIVTLIIGFAAQRLIEDVISGLFIVLEGQYNVGDIIILDDFRGTVKRIGVRTTTVVDPGGNFKVVNNSDIRNFQNRSKALSLAVSEIGITYGEDIPHAEAIIKAALPGMYERNDDVFEAVPDYMGVEELADSAVVLRFTVACKEQNVFIARRRLNRELRILFAEKGIEVPFPQVTVWKGEQD